MRMLLISIIVGFLQVQSFHTNSQELLQTSDDYVKNDVFRNIVVSGNNGKYEVTGEIRSTKGEFFYSIEDGHNELIPEKKEAINASHSEWSTFSLALTISKERIPRNGTVILYLFEKNSKKEKTNVYPVVLEQAANQ